MVFTDQPEDEKGKESFHVTVVRVVAHSSVVTWFGY